MSNLFFVLLITSGTGLRPVLGTDSDAADDQTHLKSDREHKFTLVKAVKTVKGCQNNQITFPTLLQNQNKKCNMSIFFLREKIIFCTKEDNYYGISKTLCIRR